MSYKTKYINLLFTIKKRTPLFLSKKSILNLGDFINGFWFGVDYTDIKESSNIVSLLTAYIHEKYKVSKNKNIYNCLLYLSDSDEEKAFDLFFEELEIFLKENNIEIPEIE